MTTWTWDPDKAEENKRKHGVAFETAPLVFDDPLQRSVPDLHPDGDRWRTMGVAAGIVLLFVMHTDPDEHPEGIGRIISARRATSHERKEYEDG